MEKQTENKFKAEKFTGYSIILWERGIKEFTGEEKFFNYSFSTYTDLVFYFYCVLYANKKIEYPFDEFMAELDNYPNAVTEFISDYNKHLDVQTQFMKQGTDKKKQKKGQD
jgi:hypothetical protein